MVDVIESKVGVCGGEPVIKGTRIPVSLIFELVALHYSIDEILDFYPTLTKEIIIKVLEVGKELQETIHDVDIKTYLEKELVQD
jgi:uncharacterized protein (DUF433 family)